MELDEQNNKALKAAERGDKDEFLTSLFTYLSVAFAISKEKIASADWHDVATAYDECIRANLPRLPLPIFVEGENVTYPWDYFGRNWYLWANRLASAYGWKLDYIAELDIDDATALAQEILIDDQFQREWEWRRTEIAYSYDEKTKKTNFNELPRPKWMKGVAVKEREQPKLHALPKKMIPVGLVLKPDGTNRNA